MPFSLLFWALVSASSITQAQCCWCDRAGRCRSQLDLFVYNYTRPREHKTSCLPSRCYVDHVQFSFASAVQTVLRWHSASLLHLMESVEDRRGQESMEKLGPNVGWTTLQNRIEGRIRPGSHSIACRTRALSLASSGHPELEDNHGDFDNYREPQLQSIRLGTGPGGKV